jgi:hypothetical protein
MRSPGFGLLSRRRIKIKPSGFFVGQRVLLVLFCSLGGLPESVETFRQGVEIKAKGADLILKFLHSLAEELLDLGHLGLFGCLERAYEVLRWIRSSTLASWISSPSLMTVAFSSSLSSSTAILDDVV